MYSKRLKLLNLPSLELRHLYSDLIWAYKIVLVTFLCWGPQRQPEVILTSFLNASARAPSGPHFLLNGLLIFGSICLVTPLIFLQPCRACYMLLHLWYQYFVFSANKWWWWWWWSNCSVRLLQGSVLILVKCTLSLRPEIFICLKWKCKLQVSTYSLNKSVTATRRSN